MWVSRNVVIKETGYLIGEKKTMKQLTNGIIGIQMTFSHVHKESVKVTSPPLSTLYKER